MTMAGPAQLFLLSSCSDGSVLALAGNLPTEQISRRAKEMQNALEAFGFAIRGGMYFTVPRARVFTDRSGLPA
jgi:hypothetical protein